jgi:hypothetical protein
MVPFTGLLDDLDVKVVQTFMEFQNIFQSILWSAFPADVSDGCGCIYKQAFRLLHQFFEG